MEQFLFADKTAAYLTDSLDFHSSNIHLIAFLLTFIGLVVGVYFMAKVMEGIVAHYWIKYSQPYSRSGIWNTKNGDHFKWIDLHSKSTQFSAKNGFPKIFVRKQFYILLFQKLH
jgi:hypothetical protein